MEDFHIYSWYCKEEQDGHTTDWQKDSGKFHRTFTLVLNLLTPEEKVRNGQSIQKNPMRMVGISSFLKSKWRISEFTHDTQHTDWHTDALDIPRDVWMFLLSSTNPLTKDWILRENTGDTHKKLKLSIYQKQLTYAYGKIYNCLFSTYLL